MNRPILRRVRRFVHDVTQMPLRDITPETSLYLDLQMDLESAQRFFARFATAFQVDLANLDLTPYFTSQPHLVHDGFAGAAFALFLTVDRHRRAGVKPFVVADLVALLKE
ncbi:MAG TPA: DUF1493 family protein [Gemmataceae bacterium]|nr:DUF1493 family protein [Gemmataceae bacterium]